MLDLGDATPETSDIVSRRVEVASHHLPAVRLAAAPDSGMKCFPHPVAFAKLRALADGMRQAA